MKILMLEPHGDDVLLSCNSILETNNDITLLTFSDRSSENLVEHYPSIKNYKFLNIPTIWTDYPLLKSHEVHRKFNNKENLLKYLDDIVIDIYKEFYYSTCELIKEKLKLELDNNQYDIAVCCAALCDPHHVAVRNSWIDLNKSYNIPTMFYADKYYYQNRYGREVFESIKKVLNLNNETPKEFNRLLNENTKVKDILYSVYPSESKLLRFYSEIILWYPCKYIYNSNDKVEELINGMGK